jgi:hypothetical protein
MAARNIEAGSVTSQEGPPTVVVTADFGESADYPLSKSNFGVYNSGAVRLSHYDRDIALFDEVKPNSLRIDLWWGGGRWSPQPVAGGPDAVAYYFKQMDHLASLLNERQILPCWAYSYIPPPLQANPGNWREVSGNPKLWGEILGTFARHAREGGLKTRIGYHEIYNEPDNWDFFRSGRDDYFALYREGSRAIRAADPDAVIGGPAIAFTAAWVSPFLEMVIREQLPLDFFSFHFYPGCWGTNTIADVVREMRRELARRPELATAEMHLNEYNSYPIDYPKGGRQDRYPIAAAMLQDYEWFLSQPDLAQVSWAQFQDTAGGNWSGMISFEGRRKALFNAAAVYARMPADRRQLDLRGASGIGGMASSDEHRASLVIWNRSGSNQTVKVLLPHIPFPRGSLGVYRIDAEHSSWGDNPTNELLTTVETHPENATDNLQWIGTFPSDGVVYLEVDDSARRELNAVPIAKLIRVLRYFPDRSSRAYADFDSREWTARLGMATESNAHEQIGVVAEDLPKRLRISVQTEGNLHRTGVNSLLGLRFDYQVGTNYTQSVLYHGPCAGSPDLYDPRRNAPMPWGTKRQADRVIAVTELSQFSVSPADRAPQGWNGKAQITFLMQNTGQQTRSKFSLRRE